MDFKRAILGWVMLVLTTTAPGMAQAPPASPAAVDPSGSHRQLNPSGSTFNPNQLKDSLDRLHTLWVLGKLAKSIQSNRRAARLSPDLIQQLQRLQGRPASPANLPPPLDPALLRQLQDSLGKGQPNAWLKPDEIDRLRQWLVASGMPGGPGSAGLNPAQMEAARQAAIQMMRQVLGNRPRLQGLHPGGPPGRWNRPGSEPGPQDRHRPTAGPSSSSGPPAGVNRSIPRSITLPRPAREWINRVVEHVLQSMRQADDERSGPSSRIGQWLNPAVQDAARKVGQGLPQVQDQLRQISGPFGSLAPHRWPFPALPRVAPDGWHAPAVPSADSLRPVLAILLVGGLGLLIWQGILLARASGVVADRFRSGRKPLVIPQRLSDRAELVRVFDALALAKLGDDSDWVNHREIARRLASERPADADRAFELAALYERARYTPAEQRFDPRDLRIARDLLVQFSPNPTGRV